MFKDNLSKPELIMKAITYVLMDIYTVSAKIIYFKKNYSNDI